MNEGGTCLNREFSRISRMTRIIDFGVVKLYCVRLPRWYVYAREGCPDFSENNLNCLSKNGVILI